MTPRSASWASSAHELLPPPVDHGHRQAAEGDDRIETVTDFPQKEAVDGLHVVGVTLGEPKPMPAWPDRRTPALVVMMMTTLRKSIRLPL